MILDDVREEEAQRLESLVDSRERALARWLTDNASRVILGLLARGETGLAREAADVVEELAEARAALDDTLAVLADGEDAPHVEEWLDIED